MKSAEEILNRIFYNAGEHETPKDIALQAMHEYAEQDRWVKVDKDNLPTCEVLAINACGCYAIGILGIGTHGDVICYNKQLTMYDVTHYQIPTPPKD